MFDLYEEFKRLVEALNERDIDYALCGGLAMAIYDHPRATVDIDMLILSASLNAVFDLATGLGYTIRGSDMSFAKGAIEIRRISKIHEQTGHLLSLDLLLVTPGIQEVWDTRVEVDWEGGSLFVVARDGLISLKTLRNSPLDNADILALREDVDDATN